MDKQYPQRQWAHGADLVVSQLEAQGVRQVFGIPGAKSIRFSTRCWTPQSALFRYVTRPTPPLWPPRSGALPAKRASRW